jgi:hypothetical protein
MIRGRDFAATGLHQTVRALSSSFNFQSARGPAWRAA